MNADAGRLIEFSMQRHSDLSQMRGLDADDRACVVYRYAEIEDAAN